jgi:uncharacterized protein (DUF433 family)
MALHIAAVPVPLAAGDDGIVRIRGTRVPLETVVFEFCRGATAEEIAQDYSSLALPDIYAVIAFYLAHRKEVEAYLQERTTRRRQIRAQVEARFPPEGIRARLLARRDNPAPGDEAASCGR